MPKLDLTAGIPYLDALRAAESIPWLVNQYPVDMSDDCGSEQLLEEAMSQVDEWCPWLWPYIDADVVRGLEARDW
jgi:hypothetical protein